MPRPGCCISLSGTASALIVTETYEQVMAAIDETRDQRDGPSLFAAPLVRVTGWIPGGACAPAAFAAHAVVAVCAVPAPEPDGSGVPDAPPEWLGRTLRDGEADQA